MWFQNWNDQSFIRLRVTYEPVINLYVGVKVRNWSYLETVVFLLLIIKIFSKWDHSSLLIQFEQLVNFLRRDSSFSNCITDAGVVARVGIRGSDFADYLAWRFILRKTKLESY